MVFKKTIWRYFGFQKQSDNNENLTALMAFLQRCLAINFLILLEKSNLKKGKTFLFSVVSSSTSLQPQHYLNSVDPLFQSSLCFQDLLCQLPMSGNVGCVPWSCLSKKNQYNLPNICSCISDNMVRNFTCPCLSYPILWQKNRYCQYLVFLPARYCQIMPDIAIYYKYWTLSDIVGHCLSDPGVAKTLVSSHTPALLLF